MVRSENGTRVKMSSGVKNPEQSKPQQWNVQVVRGKVTTRCLWNACKALSIGLLLLAIGTTMAIIGYYADQLSIRSEMRGNSTVSIRNESRGFHLNNLSYAGPIVMGVGGFIVVAACVMTFEARDSAAKVVPARFKSNQNASLTGENSKTVPRAPRSFQRIESRRSMTLHTPRKGGRCIAHEKMKNSEWPPQIEPPVRKTFNAAFVQFSRELMESSPFRGNRRWGRRMNETSLNKSPSAPDLIGGASGAAPRREPRQASADARAQAAGKGCSTAANRKKRECVRALETAAANHHRLQRQALSMDYPFYDSSRLATSPSLPLSRQHTRRSTGSRDSDLDLDAGAAAVGSQTSMALDLHECQVTLKVKDESMSKRSEMSRRHQLLRQEPVEEEWCCCCRRMVLGATGGKCSSAGSRPSQDGRLSSQPRDSGGQPSYLKRKKKKIRQRRSLRSPCHRCRPCGTSPFSKTTRDFRSQSFSQSRSNCDCIRSPCRKTSPRVFCIDDHCRANHSSENIGFCCEEKLRCMDSPLRSPPQQRLPCRAKERSGIAPPRKSKLEGSLSAEERGTPRAGAGVQPRSGSFSPIGHAGSFGNESA